ncbi:MAG: DMT family transporter [Anaerolineales bacterium]|nr:DMT family transporter [Anaerolineales bacterium]
MTTKMIHQSTSFPRHAFALLILGAFAIGFSPIFVRLSAAGPIATGFWRMGLALPFLWGGMVWHDQKQVVKKRPFSTHDFLLLFLAAAFFTADLSLWHTALGLTTVANATLLPNFFPVFVTLGAWLLFGQRVTRLFLIGMLLALVGATLLIGTSAAISRQTLVGDLLALSTAVVYSGYFLTISRLRHRYSAFTVMAWVSIIAALLLLAETLLVGEPLLVTTIQEWLVLIALALVAQVVGQSLIAYALAHLPPAFSSVTMILQPLVATIVAWLLFQEALSPLQAVGGAVVLAGILLARRGVSNQ